MNKNIHRLYRRDKLFFYGLATLGAVLGMKACDYLFYDEKKHLALRESMEEEFWSIHGEPKHLKPDIVESYLRPGEVRRSWVQITLEKDRYVPR